MQDCIGILDEAGIDIPVTRGGRRRPVEPAVPGGVPGLPGRGPAPALLDAAGEDLNYGTLAAPPSRA